MIPLIHPSISFHHVISTVDTCYGPLSFFCEVDGVKINIEEMVCTHSQNVTLRQRNFVWTGPLKIERMCAHEVKARSILFIRKENEMTGFCYFKQCYVCAVCFCFEGISILMWTLLTKHLSTLMAQTRSSLLQ